MRTAPRHITAAIHQHDRTVDLVWHQEDSTWWFTWKGQLLMPYKHTDGTMAINDLSADEAVNLLKSVDNPLHGTDKLRAWERRVRRNREVRAAEDAAAMAEAGERARDRARVHMHGPKSFVSAA